MSTVAPASPPPAPPPGPSTVGGAGGGPSVGADRRDASRHGEVGPGGRHPGVALGEGLVPVLGAAMVVVAGQPWWSAFEPSPLPGLVLAAVLPVLVVVVLARLLHLGPSASTATSTLLALVAVAAGAAGSTLGPSEVVRAVRDGSAELLSTTLPVTGAPWLLVVPILLTWLAAAIVGETLVRTRAVAPTVAAVAGLHLGAFAVTLDVGDRPLWPSLVLLGAAALLAALRRWIDTPPVAATPTGSGATAGAAVATVRPPLRPLASGAVLAVMAVLAVAVLVPVLVPDDEGPVVPERTPPVVVDEVVTPVAVVASLRRGDGGVPADEVLYRLDPSGDDAADDAADYVSVASLDLYDGDTWRYRRTFEPTGGRIPSTDGAELPAVEAEVEVVRTIPATRSWVPVPGRAERIDGIDVRYDPGTAMVLARDPLTGGERYRVTARREPRPLRELDLDDAVVSASPRPEDDEYPASLREDLRRWSARVARERDVVESATPQFLVAVEDHLRQSYARLLVAPVDGDGGDDVEGATQVGGTSFGEVAAAIGTNRAGTPEQFATLYALVVRRSGVPARVVTGFRVDPDRPDGELRAEDAWTWVEVPIEGHGWVVVDPTPTTTEEPPPQEASAASTTTTVPERPDTAEAIGGEGGAPLAPPGDLTVEDRRLTSRWWVVPVVLVLGALAVVVGSVARRAVARRGRWRGRAGPRAVGALHEVLDHLRRAGVDELPTRSATELVAVASDRLGAEVAAPVAVVVGHADRAIYGGDVTPPPASVAGEGGAPTTAADEAWTAAGATRRAVFAAMGWKRRLRTVLARPGRWR